MTIPIHKLTLIHLEETWEFQKYRPAGWVGPELLIIDPFHIFHETCYKTWTWTCLNLLKIWSPREFYILQLPKLQWLSALEKPGSWVFLRKPPGFCVSWYQDPPIHGSQGAIGSPLKIDHGVKLQSISMLVSSLLPIALIYLRTEFDESIRVHSRNDHSFSLSLPFAQFLSTSPHIVR